MIHISQRDPKYASLKFPNTNYYWSEYGCNATCVCMLLEKDPFTLCQENPNGWDSEAYMRTKDVCAKYGYKLVTSKNKNEVPTDRRVFIVTAWYADTRRSGLRKAYPTHFYLKNPDGTFTDPASLYNPKTVDKYAGYEIEYRWLEPIGGAAVNKICPCCGK